MFQSMAKRLWFSPKLQISLQEVGHWFKAKSNLEMNDLPQEHPHNQTHLQKEAKFVTIISETVVFNHHSTSIQSIFFNVIIWHDISQDCSCSNLWIEFEWRSIVGAKTLLQLHICFLSILKYSNCRLCILTLETNLWKLEEALVSLENMFQYLESSRFQFYVGNFVWIC